MTLITLQGNPIEFIDDAAFVESINTLQTLLFCGARFSQIPEAVLHLKNLSTLNLCDTNIVTWDVDAMKRLGSSMVTLALDVVGLSQWPTWLESYIHLKELTISGSFMTSMPDDALDMVAETLTTLGLQNNSFTSVPKAVFKLTALETLYLHENRIVDISWLPQKSKLSSLYLNNNKISNGSALSNALLLYADTLSDVEIHDNLLTAIPELSFLKLVLNVDLTNNLISNINSGSVPPGISDLLLGYNLFYTIPSLMKTLKNGINLNLNSNRISMIQGVDYPPFTDGADFGHNLLSELTKSSFPNNSTMGFLIFNYNPITVVSTDAFDNLPHLVSISLQHTKLTRLPLAIASLKDLNEIDVSGNVDLVCTCLEKGLESRIENILPENVIGDCGTTSVYIFFSKLSQDCPPFLEDLHD